MEALDNVNGILCLMQQTAYDRLVNIGPYNALIDSAACGMGAEGDGGNQSSGAASEFELWVVNSVRASDASRHVVGVWVPSEEHGENGEVIADLIINVRVDVEQGISDANPFGVFSMDFAGIPVDGDEPFFWGTLNSQPALEGFMGFTFFQEQGDPQGDEYQRTEVHANMFVDGSQGVARVRQTYMQDFGGGQPVQGSFEYALAFDDFNLLRQKTGDEPACLSRTDFETKVWRYALFNGQGADPGSLVERNGGLGFETADGFHGWASYWGLWWPQEAELVSGDVVTRHGQGDGETPATYTVLQAPGKLIRNTRQSLALEALDGERFDWWEFLDDPQGQGPPSEHRYAVEYTHVDGLFRKVAEWFPGDNGDELEDLAVPEVLDTASLQWLDLWSASLGGHVNFVHGDDHVTFFQEQVVNASDPVFGAGSTLALSGYFQLLDTGITAQEAEAGDVYMPDVFDVGAPVPFVFSADDLTLYHDTTGDGSALEPVGLADGQTYDSGPYGWGMRSGPLVTDTGLLGDVFDLWNQELFYIWETGPNPWNKFATLVDAEGVAVSFDPPIVFTYTHSLENDRNGDATHAGKTFQLEYYGPGDIGGIPHVGVDLDGDGQFDRWYPEFSLADGVLMGPNGDEYVIRALELEQSLVAAPGACQALNIDTVGQLPLPDGSTFQDPNIGDMPVVDDPPAVIAGEIVEPAEEGGA